MEFAVDIWPWFCDFVQFFPRPQSNTNVIVFLRSKTNITKKPRHAKIAYATNKLFGLVLMIHGGRRKFTQECFDAKSNAPPCCCLERGCPYVRLSILNSALSSSKKLLLLKFDLGPKKDLSSRKLITVKLCLKTP